MSGRSSRRARSIAVPALLLAACSAKAKPAPEADPAKVAELAAVMLANSPAPAAVRECTAADLAGGLTMTHLTLLRLAGKPIDKDPEHADWINPHELDDPAARTLADPKPDRPRQAAAMILAAPFYVVYRVDNVDAPIALGVKDLKIGTIGARVVRFDKTGQAVCAQVFFFQNDKHKSDDAIARSDRAVIDPAVQQAMKDDLASQYLTHAPRGTVPRTKPTP